MLYLIIVATILGACLLWTLLFLRQTTAAIQRWATEHGYVLLRSEVSIGVPLLAAACSLWSPAFGRVRYSASLRASDGRTQAVLISCGQFVGVLQWRDEIDVDWQNKDTA